MTRKRRRIKKQVWFVLSGIIVFTILIISITKYINRINSIPYKLEKIGYKKEEIQNIIKLKDNQIKEILSLEYNEYIDDFYQEKFFIKDNLDRYLKYKKENEKETFTDIVSTVNVDRDKEFYTDIQESDVKKGNLILVNKYNALNKDFSFDDLVNVSIQHCYGSQKLRKEAYDKFKEMFKAAKEEDLTIIINSSYRDYAYQEKLWNRYSNTNGEEWADKFAARKGHSEHQTGLAIDVTTYNVKNQDDFELTDEFKWLDVNAYKYGFILRYPKDKENITGYSYEPWHYRYVGVDIATQVYELGLTYDEYYAYYLK